jgi:hypothetical protein
MIDKWFLQEIDHNLERRNRVVIVDPSEKCQFLLSILDGRKYVVLEINSDFTEDWQMRKEELLLRYEAETNYKNRKVVFYAPRNKEKLSFLFDYCATHGCVDLTNPYEWLRKKLFTNTKLQVKLDNSLLFIAAKCSVGKDLDWWKRILQNLEEIINIDDILLPFLHQPEEYITSQDSDVRDLIEIKLSELLDQQRMRKPPKTIATEIVKKLFDGLLRNDIPPALLELYYRWADSEKYRRSLDDYLQSYIIRTNADPWLAHPDHCFHQLDRIAIQEVATNIRNEQFLIDKIEAIKSRANSHKVRSYIPKWWQDIINLIEYDSENLVHCTTFPQVVDFYTGQFSDIDRSIRNLYCTFLNEEDIIRPLQEFYENLNHELLEQWFSVRDGYQSNQHGFLPNLLKNAEPGLAIIVGDGIRYEIADFVAKELNQQYRIDKQIMLADMPSETEHNMSALYVDNGTVIPIHKNREKKLIDIAGKDIKFMGLEKLNYGTKCDYLVLTYRDIDSAAEKLQDGALKLFEEFEKTLINKISLLFKIGYDEVHLVTDHGFVLTGLLEESDKIEANVSGQFEAHERFIRTKEKQDRNDWLSFDVSYKEYNFVYVAKNHRPFRTRGDYGYSHGGFTPQEIIIPRFIFSNKKEKISGLEVVIINKKQLDTVTGENYIITLQAASSRTDLFSYTRTVELLIYSKESELIGQEVLSIKPEEKETREFSFDGNEVVKAVLIDGETKEELDVATIRKSKVRDLGGLL